MAEQTLNSDQLILWRRTFGAVWIVTVALLAHTFLVGGNIYLSTWWMIAITSTAFSPLVVFIVALVPFFSRERPPVRANHRAFLPVCVLAVAVGVAGFIAVGRMKSTQIEAARQSLGDLGEAFLPANTPVSSLSGPIDSIYLILKFSDSGSYLERATSELPHDWIVSDREGSRNMLSPITGGQQWFVIGSEQYVTIVRVSAGQYGDIVSQDWVHPDGTPLHKSDWELYGKES